MTKSNIEIASECGATLDAPRDWDGARQHHMETIILTSAQLDAFAERIRADELQHGVGYSAGFVEGERAAIAAQPDHRAVMQRALDRMDRTRAILTNGNPRPECNWGLLDTADLRQALEAAQPVAAPPNAHTVEQAILSLTNALIASKGWMRDYADAIIRDAVDRKSAQPSPAAVELTTETLSDSIMNLVELLASAPKAAKRVDARAWQHLLTYAPQPAAVEPVADYYAILFDDADRRPEIFTDRRSAMQRYEQVSDSWNAHLFVRVNSNSKNQSPTPPAPQPVPQERKPFTAAQRERLYRNKNAAIGKWMTLAAFHWAVCYTEEAHGIVGITAQQGGE